MDLDPDVLRVRVPEGLSWYDGRIKLSIFLTWSYTLLTPFLWFDLHQYSCFHHKRLYSWTLFCTPYKIVFPSLITVILHRKCLCLRYCLCLTAMSSSEIRNTHCNLFNSIVYRSHMSKDFILPEFTQQHIEFYQL